MSNQKLITIDKQAATSITGTNTRPSSAYYRQSVTRTGSGSIEIAGEYTGNDDAVLDVEIVAGGSPRVTVPSFNGVGSGSMTSVAALTATEQEWVFDLVSLGIDTTHAEMTIDSLILRSVATGAAGNSISVNVDLTPITNTDSGYSLIDPISKDDSTLDGIGFDFDTVEGTKDKIPATAKRIRFADDETIYRNWKYRDGGEYVYRILPPAVKDYSAGDTVYHVTGGRTVTITDGVTTEIYTNIITLFDLVSAITNDPSALVEVIGIIDGTMTPENDQAVIDLQLRTDARLAYTKGYGSDAAIGATNITVGTNASTELITAECIASTIKDGGGIGLEKWALSASVTNLANATITSGDTYAESTGKFSFTIPKKVPVGYDSLVRGDISYNIIYNRDNDRNTFVEICVDALRLGPNAEDKVIRWVYTRRPESACPCESISYAPLPDGCLTGTSSTAIVANPEYKLRRERLRAIGVNDTMWRTRIRPQTYRETLSHLLDDLFTGTLSWPDYQSSTAYAENDVFQDGDYKYRVTTAGTSSGSPSLLTGIGAAGSDGTVGYECIALLPLVWWDHLYEEAKKIPLDDVDDPAKPYDDQAFFDYLFRTRPAILAAADIYLDAAAEGDTVTDNTGCWLETTDNFWWVPDDSLYLPAFTNNEYHSVKGTTKQPIPTHEFGFVIKVDPACQYQPVEGDTVEIKIGNAGWESTYQRGDKIIIATIAAADASMSGGIDGTDELTWNVTGATSGTTAQYVVDKASPVLYDNGEIQALITPGGVDYTLGDNYRFCVESGQFRWRIDSGTWSTPATIANTVLPNGLEVQFSESACPSFVVGDAVRYVVEQPNKAGNMLIPHDDYFRWTGADTVITIVCSGQVTDFAIGLHTLPATASIILNDGTNNHTIPPFAGVAYYLFATPLSSPTLTLTITGAAGAEIGWIFAGDASIYSVDAYTGSLSPGWDMYRSGGLNPTGSKRGRRTAANVTWDGFLTYQDYDNLIASIDSHKIAGDVPAIWVPTDAYAKNAIAVQFPDEFTAEDMAQFSCENNENISINMTLKGWAQ